MKSPKLPKDVLKKTVWIARMDGGSVLGIAGFLAVVSAAFGDYTGAIIAALIAGAGAAEIHGAALLSRWNEAGVSWLVGSQLYLLAAVLGYAGWRLAHYDAAAMEQMLKPFTDSGEFKSALAEGGVSKAQWLGMVRGTYFATFKILAALTVLYQGGLALYYRRRRAVLATILSEEGPPQDS